MPRDIGPAVLPQLDNEAVRAYRLSYRKFRGGESRGSKGEDPEVWRSSIRLFNYFEVEKNG